MDEAQKRIAVDRFLEIISSARERPHMYFDPIGPVALTHWLHGLRTGIYEWGGIFWPSDFRKGALDSRGLEELAAFECDQLENRGLSPREVVYELLSIEIEMWQSFRESLGVSN